MRTILMTTALAGLLLSGTAFAGEQKAKLLISEVDPMSIDAQATRGIMIPDPVETSSISPEREVAVALAAIPEMPVAARADDVPQPDPAFTTGPAKRSSVKVAELDRDPVVELVAVAPTPTPRPRIAAAARPSAEVAAVRRPGAIAQRVAPRASVQLVSENEPALKRRTYRYPGPILVGVY